MRLPNGYESGMVAGATYVVRRGLERFVRDAIESAGSLGAFAEAGSVCALPGRGEAHVIEAPRMRLVVRHYRRGGAVASMLGDRYLRGGTPRPFRELWVSATSRARGVSTPAVAAAVVHPSGIFYRGDLATDFVAGAMTLADVTFGESRMDEEARHSAWHAAGLLVRSAAEAGLVHADLNLRNVLIAWRSGRPVTYLLDLDRCRIAARVSPRELRRMKARLRRSARRFEERTGDTVGPSFDAFEEGASG
jgi:3-deoxy-D-manno-octulosonic acid kinase